MMLLVIALPTPGKLGCFGHLGIVLRLSHLSAAEVPARFPRQYRGSAGSSPMRSLRRKAASGVVRTAVMRMLSAASKGVSQERCSEVVIWR